MANLSLLLMNLKSDQSHAEIESCWDRVTQGKVLRETTLQLLLLGSLRSVCMTQDLPVTPCLSSKEPGLVSDCLFSGLVFDGQEKYCVGEGQRGVTDSRDSHVLTVWGEGGGNQPTITERGREHAPGSRSQGESEDLGSPGPAALHRRQ